MTCGHTETRNIICSKVISSTSISSSSSSLNDILLLDCQWFYSLSVKVFTIFNTTEQPFIEWGAMFTKNQKCPWRAGRLQRNGKNIWKPTKYCRSCLAVSKMSKTSDEWFWKELLFHSSVYTSFNSLKPEWNACHSEVSSTLSKWVALKVVCQTSCGKQSMKGKTTQIRWRSI